MQFFRCLELATDNFALTIGSLYQAMCELEQFPEIDEKRLSEKLSKARLIRAFDEIRGWSS